MRDSTEPLAIEGLILELMAVAQRERMRPFRRPPPWLRIACSSPALGIDNVSRRDTSCLSVTRKAKSVGKRPVKHERVIHTRVPVVLEEELKRFADNLRVPISNLIRTILEDALAVADRAGHRVDRELRSGLAQLAHGREILRRKLTRRIPRRMPRG